MKIRKPWLIKTAGFLGTVLARIWIRTLRLRLRYFGPSDPRPQHCGDGVRYIYAVWHENLLLPALTFAGRDMHVLISQSADAQMFVELLRHLRVPVIRGSTRRGGVEAVRRILRTAGRTHLAVTPDGPRGPRRQVQAGVVYLAARTGLPIVPAGIGYNRPWRLKSWDRFAIPRPWTLGTFVAGAPVVVPPEAGKAELDHYRQVVEEGLHAVSDIAERWAQNGRWPSVASRLGESRQAG